MDGGWHFQDLGKGRSYAIRQLPGRGRISAVLCPEGNTFDGRLPKMTEKEQKTEQASNPGSFARPDARAFNGWRGSCTGPI